MTSACRSLLRTAVSAGCPLAHRACVTSLVCCKRYSSWTCSLIPDLSLYYRHTCQLDHGDLDRALSRCPWLDPIYLAKPRCMCGQIMMTVITATFAKLKTVGFRRLDKRLRRLCYFCHMHIYWVNAALYEIFLSAGVFLWMGRQQRCCWLWAREWRQRVIGMIENTASASAAPPGLYCVIICQWKAGRRRRISLHTT